MKPKALLVLLGLLWARTALATWCIDDSVTVLTGYEGTIAEGDGDPTHMDPAGPKHCEWLIQPVPLIDPSTQTIRLEFSYAGFGFYQSDLVVTDLPSFYRYDFTGPDPTEPGMSTFPKPVESLGDTLDLVLQGMGSGFILTWKVVPRVPREPQCVPEAYLYDRSGSLSNGWGNYYAEWQCLWHIDPFVSADGIAPPTAAPDESVTVHLDHIDTEKGWDFVHVVDDINDVYWTGHTASCSTVQGEPGKPVHIQFLSDAIFTYGGFDLSYTTEPAPAVCPAADFVAATFSQAEVLGDRLVVTTTGYSLSEYRIAQGPPTTQTNPACILPAVRHVPDPEGAPCTTELSACTLLTTLASCPDVSTEMVDENTLQWHVPLHVLSTVQTGVDPNGDPVFGTRWQSMDILIEQTVSTEASATVHAMHLVNFTGFEKGDSYFDKTAEEYVLHFSVWTNQPYRMNLSTPYYPWLESHTSSVPAERVSFTRNPDGDRNCDDGEGPADPTRFCERAFVMTIDQQPNTCDLDGGYMIGIRVDCSEEEHCPSGTEGDYFFQVVIVPGNCEATLIEIVVTGDLWVEMDGGTALAWGRRCTVMGELHADTTLASSRLHELYVCTLPLDPGTTTCAENDHALLIVDDALTPWAEALDGLYLHSTMLFNTTFDLDLLAFHYTLGVDTNPNLITELQFDAVFDSFVPGHIDPPGANGNGNKRTTTTVSSRRTVRPTGNSHMPTPVKTVKGTANTKHPQQPQQQQQQQQQQHNGRRVISTLGGQQHFVGKQPVQHFQKRIGVAQPRPQQQWSGQRHMNKMTWITPQRASNRRNRVANSGEDQGPLVPPTGTALQAKLAIQGSTTPVTPEPTPGTPTGSFNWGTVALVAGTVGGTLLVTGCLVAALMVVRSWRQRVQKRKEAAPTMEAEECRQAANPRVEVLKAVVGTSSAVSPALSRPSQRHTPAPPM